MSPTPLTEPLPEFTVLLIDDQRMVRDYLGAVIGKIPGFRLIGAAVTRAEGLALAREFQPDILLLDLILPDGDGFTLAGELALGANPPRIVFCTERWDDVTLHRAMRPPCCGLLPKSCLSPDCLGHALWEVARGGSYFPDEVRTAWREMEERGAMKCLDWFTSAETTLLPGFGQGLTDDEIAARRGGSARTVRRHRQSVLAKLGLHSSMELVHWALDKGFVVPVPGRGVELRDGTGSNGPW